MINKIVSNKKLLNIKSYTPGKPIEELKREMNIKGQISKMASNENFMPPSKKVISALKSNISKINRYPDSNCYYLRKALSKTLKVKEENLIFGNGSDELIILALRAFCGKNDEIVIAKPTFLIYQIAASQIAGVKIKFVPLTKQLKYDLPAMRRAVNKNTKIVFIANPDNPTGSYVNKKEMETLLKGINSNVIVFVDEAYFEFAAVKKDFPRILKYIKKKNLIITRTFSKAHALAGLRIGYGIAKKEIINAMSKVKEPFNINYLAQVAAIEAIKDTAYTKKSLRACIKGKTFLCNQLKGLGYEFVESATNFVLINLKKKAKPVYKKLLRKGIIVREMSGWGLDNYIRVTVGSMKQNRDFIRELER